MLYVHTVHSGNVGKARYTLATYTLMTSRVIGDTIKLLKLVYYHFPL